jgi:hypothetical protein
VTKLIEFRFDTLRRASENYYNCARAAYVLRQAVRKQRKSESELGVERTYLAGRVHDVREQFHSRLTEAVSCKELMGALFPKAFDHWSASIDGLIKIRRDHDEDSIWKHSTAADDEWLKFSRIAIRKCGFYPWGAWGKRLQQILTATDFRRDEEDAP